MDRIASNSLLRRAGSASPRHGALSNGGLRLRFRTAPAAALAVLVVVAFGSGAGSALRAEEGGERELTGKDIQALVRYSHALQDVSLKGLLRSSTERVPFVLSVRDRSVAFDFTDPPETITLSQHADGYSLVQEAGASSGDVPKERYGQPVRGTDVLYEDLSMRFLYWEKAELLGEETIRNRLTWKVHILNTTDGGGPYSQVYIWVDQVSGGLMRMEAFDWTPGGAKRIKMYQVVSGQKVNGNWVLKKMNVETYDPATGKLVGRTALELRE